MFCFECSSTEYKMNDRVYKFLLAGHKFMPEIHLKQTASFNKSGFTYSARGPFSKDKKESEGLKRQEIRNIFIKMS